MEHIKSRAWELWASVRVEKFPFDALSLNSKNLGFRITSYSNARDYIRDRGWEDYANTHDGFAVKDADGPMVFYSDELTYSSRNTVIMHEVAHIDLGHTTYNSIYGHSSDKTVQNKQEDEADLFALSFLAPAPILLKMKAFRAVEISRETGLSEMDSHFIAAEVQREKSAGFSDIADRIVTSFEPYIRNYLYRKGVKRRRILAAVLGGIALVLATMWFSASRAVPTVQNNTQQVQDAQQDAQQSDTVDISATYYVTKSGDKYHTEDCNYVEGKGIPITLENAKKEGYTPCKVCDPTE